MKAHIYTDEEIKKLKNNKYVLDVLYKRQIKYDTVFKLWCIFMRLQYPELSAKEIFKVADFPVDILHYKLPQRRIKEWLDNYIKYGSNYFIDNMPYYNVTSSKVKTYKNLYLIQEMIDLYIKKIEELLNER